MIVFFGVDVRWWLGLMVLLKSDVVKIGRRNGWMRWLICLKEEKVCIKRSMMDGRKIFYLMLVVCGMLVGIVLFLDGYFCVLVCVWFGVFVVFGCICIFNLFCFLWL